MGFISKLKCTTKCNGHPSALFFSPTYTFCILVMFPVYIDLYTFARFRRRFRTRNVFEVLNYTIKLVSQRRIVLFFVVPGGAQESSGGWCEGSKPPQGVPGDHSCENVLAV